MVCWNCGCKALDDEVRRCLVIERRGRMLFVVCVVGGWVLSRLLVGCWVLVLGLLGPLDVVEARLNFKGICYLLKLNYLQHYL
jgi:hypothetical protein